MKAYHDIIIAIHDGITIWSGGPLSLTTDGFPLVSACPLYSLHVLTERMLFLYSWRATYR